MTDLFTASPLVPFAIALGVVVFFLCVELIGMVLGFSSMDDGADIDLDMEIDLSPEFDVDADLSRVFGDADLDIDMDADAFNLWTFLELGRVPFIIWIISVAGAFALSGYGIQLGLNAVFGFMLPPLIAVVASIPLTLFVGKFFVELFAAIAPKSSTQAINRRSLGGTTGVITVGTASKGNPAMAKVVDYHGNSHNIRVVPFGEEPALPQGTRIVVLTGEQDGVFWALSLEKAKERFNMKSKKD